MEDEIKKELSELDAVTLSLNDWQVQDDFLNEKSQDIVYDVMVEKEKVGEITLRRNYTGICLEVKIDEPFRNHGYGRKAVQATTDLAFSLGVESLYTFVEYHNKCQIYSNRIFENSDWYEDYEKTEGGSVRFYRIYNREKNKKSSL